MQELAKIDEPVQAIILYKITPAEIAKQLKNYDHLKVIKADTKSYKEVRAALTSIVATRVEVDKRRKQLGEDARKLVSNFNQAAKMLIEPMTPYEDRFKSELTAEDDRKAAIKAEKEAKDKERIEKIRAKILAIQMSGTGFLSMMPLEDLRELSAKLDKMEISAVEYMEFKEEAQRVLDDTYDSVQLAIVTAIQREKEKAERKAEAERLEKVRKEQEEAQKKIDEENQEIEKKRKELEQKEFERQATIKVEIEAKERVEQKELERLKREEAESKERLRQEALKPDKEKLIKWIQGFNDTTNPNPQLKSKEAKEIMRIALEHIEVILQDAMDKTEKL